MGAPLNSACTDLHLPHRPRTGTVLQVDFHGAAHAGNSPVLMIRFWLPRRPLVSMVAHRFTPSTGDTASVKHNDISDRCGAFLRQFFISLLLGHLTGWGSRGFLASTTPETHVHDSAQPGNRPSLHTSEVVEQAEAPVAIKALEHVQGSNAPSRL